MKRSAVRTVLALLATLVTVTASMMAAVAGAVASVVAAAVSLTATALIVPGTGVPNPAAVPGYMTNAVDYYIAPTTESCALECEPVPVPYIAQFWPFPWNGWGGLTGARLDESIASGLTRLTSDLVGTYRPGPDSPLVIFGFSQGATVASRQKALLRDLPAESQTGIDFVLIGNPNRPNGGLFERLAAFGTVPILDATFGMPTPTDTAMPTVDIAFQYDGVADFPLYPLNLLASLNAAAGFWYTHGSYLSPNARNADELPNGLTPDELAAAIADPANQQRLAGSDTTYVLIPTPNLPLLQPLREFGAFTGTEFLTAPLIALVEPALRVLIETGYDRSIPYGQPAPFRLLGPVDPIAVAVDLVGAVGEGVRDALAVIGGPPSSSSPPPAVSGRMAAAAMTPVGARSGPPQRPRPDRSAPARALSSVAEAVPDKAGRPDRVVTTRRSAASGNVAPQLSETSAGVRGAAAAAPGSRR